MNDAVPTRNSNVEHEPGTRNPDARSHEPGTGNQEPGTAVHRQYPDRPFVGVGAVVVDGGKVLIVKRKHEPLAGQWSIPGGGVEVGETLEDCVAREILEETGLEIAVGPVVEVLDRITRDDDGRVRYHFVLVDYLCWVVGGALAPASDVLDARLVEPSDLPAYGLASITMEVIGRALDLDRAAPRPVR